MGIVRSLKLCLGSKPSHCPLPVKPGLGILVGLVAEIPIDPLDHRYLYVLVSVFDNTKHYFVGDDELGKPLGQFPNPKPDSI